MGMNPQPKSLFLVQHRGFAKQTYLFHQPLKSLEMKEINIGKFGFGVWFKFQLIVVGIGVALSLASLEVSSIAGVFYFEMINAAFSAVGCLSYTLIVYFWKNSIEKATDANLKFILYHAGWLNVVFLFTIFAIGVFFLNEDKASILPVAGFSLLIVLIGLLAIHQEASKLVIYDNDKLERLVNEMGTLEQEA